MVRITEELLRKRSEHNDGLLTDLQEISLHQQEIEHIDTIGTLCRHLRILLLQNNVISSITGLRKLKELEYLNLALNNIQVVDGLDGCESLKKLDLTVNFIDYLRFRESLLNLRANTFIEDLYLVGNPCMDWPMARQYVVAMLPLLKQLDGTLITPTERISSSRKLPVLESELQQLAQKRYSDLQSGAYAPVYTREERLEQYREQAAQKEVKEQREKDRLGTDIEAKKAAKVAAIRESLDPLAPLLNAAGEARQCNEGKVEFRLDEWSSGLETVLTVRVPRFLDSSLIDCHAGETWVRVVVKGKVLQLRLSDEVKFSDAKIVRARVDGVLRVELPKKIKRELSKIDADQDLKPKSVKNTLLEPTKKPGNFSAPLIQELGFEGESVQDDLPPPLEPGSLSYF